MKYIWICGRDSRKSRRGLIVVCLDDSEHVAYVPFDTHFRSSNTQSHLNFYVARAKIDQFRDSILFYISNQFSVFCCCFLANVHRPIIITRVRREFFFLLFLVLSVRRRRIVGAAANLISYSLTNIARLLHVQTADAIA